MNGMKKYLGALVLLIGTSGLSVAHLRAQRMALAISPSSEAIQHVSNDGNDSNDGSTWGLPKATIAGALASLPSAGGTIEVAPGYTAAFSSQILLGNAAIGNTKFVKLELGTGSTLTWNGSGCAIAVPNGSSINGQQSLGGITGRPGNWPVIQLGSNAMPPLICNSDMTGRQEYFAMSDVEIYGNGASNQTAPLVDLTAVSIPSYIRDTLIWNWGGPLLYLSSGSSADPAYFGPFTCDNCWLNGFQLSGAQPLVLVQPSPFWQIQSVNFKGGSIEHAGSGEPEVQCIGGNAPGRNISGFNLLGTYIENSFSTSDAADLTNCQFTLAGVTVGGIAGTDLVKVIQSVGDALPSTIIGLQDVTGAKFATTIQNTATGFSYVAPSGSVPFYVFAQPGFIGSQAIFDGIPVSASSGLNLQSQHLLLSGTPPSIAAGFGTSASIVNFNGSAAFELDVGSGGTARSGVIGMPTASNGWSCQVNDMGETATRESSYTADTVTLTANAPWGENDHLLLSCSAF
jgi:hypothetical protein